MSRALVVVTVCVCTNLTSYNHKLRMYSNDDLYYYIGYKTISSCTDVRNRQPLWLSVRLKQAILISFLA